MPTQVTVALDTGGFLPPSSGQSYLEVGYFETGLPYDIVVTDDRTQVVPPPNIKLGKGNHRIDVEHVAADGTVKAGISESAYFSRNLLRKVELYGIADSPDFKEAEYDCVLRFHSGDFDGSDLRERRFKECSVSTEVPTGNEKTTRPVVNDVLVHFYLSKGEELRLMKNDGKPLWSSGKAGDGFQRIQVKILADPTTDSKYYNKALKHKKSYCWLPNPDPPPGGAP